MLITYHGHAKFCIETESGMTIVTDPFDAGVGYPIQPVKADITLVSHGHHDHNAVDTLTEAGRVIDQAGTYTWPEGVSVRAILSDHDDVNGEKRGKTLLFCVETEGLRLVHLGDLGRMLTAEEIALLSPADIVMVPVGGFYTINADVAKQVCDALNPQVIIPMHYRTEVNAGWPIESEEPFVKQFHAREVEKVASLRVTKGDLLETMRVAVLEHP